MSTFFVRVPRNLTWDKLTALYVWTRCHVPAEERPMGPLSLWLGHGIHVLFEDEPVPDGDVVDIDVTQQYHEGGYGSATERVVEEFGIHDLSGMAHLLTLLRQNNATGYLKDLNKYPQSFVWLIRELMASGSPDLGRKQRLAAIYALWQGVEVYFRACEVDEQRVTTMENPFTLKSFTALCEIARIPEETVQRSVDELGRAFQRAERLRNRAKGRAAEITPVQAFGVPVEGSPNRVLAAHLIKTDNLRLPRAYFRLHPEVALLIAQRHVHGGGHHYAIFVRGAQNLQPLHDALELEEPGCWVLKFDQPDDSGASGEKPSQSPIVMNGSGSREAPASRLAPQRLIEIVRAKYTHRNRAMRSHQPRRR